MVDTPSSPVNGSRRRGFHVSEEDQQEAKGASDFWSTLEDDSDSDGGGPSSSRPPTPPVESRTTSRSQSTGAVGRDEETPRRAGRQKKEKVAFAPPLIETLPIAWDEAHETFEVLERCVYETKRLGASREQDEMMVCDCMFDRRNADAEQCGSHSDCVNRAIFIECLAHECNAKGQCRNQRFTKRQFANLEIVQTEMKGYGLRAGSDIASGDLIYEYIGEVVGETTFRKRMASYGDEGIKHFYFMMLQKEEYIDATKKGGIGRFANHSCNPNCEVQKWVVGRRLRMGIFAKRDVLQGEEITFNYNVDRYGHEAQICYCGEPNCVGYIGGKTQTDIGGMNDLFLDALGITDQVEAEGMKGSKKKKARHLDEDFTPILKPMLEPEVSKVAAAIRQSMDNQRMMRMLLERVKMSEEASIHRQMVRMHGLSLMFMILTDLAEDRELVLLALQSMVQWKLQLRNKIEDANIEEPVKRLQGGDDAELKDLAQRLLDQWSTLEMSYKIPRKSKIASLDEEDDANTTTIAEAKPFAYTEHRRPQAWENTDSIQFTVAPVKFRPPSSFIRPPRPPLPPSTKSGPIISGDRLKLDAIIALAQQNAAAAAATPPTPQQSGTDSPAPSVVDSPQSSRREEDGLSRSKRAKTSHQGSDGYLGSYGGEEDEADKKEKKLMKLVGEVVVKSMSKYKEMMDHETFKKYARDCTHTLVEKEKRSSSYQSHRNPTLSEDKKAKIKSFTKEFTHKLMKRLKEKGKLKRPTSSSSTNHHRNGQSSSSALSTPGPTIANTPSSTTMTSLNLETPRTNVDDDEEMNDIFGSDAYIAGEEEEEEEDMRNIDVDAELEGMEMTPLANKTKVNMGTSPVERIGQKSPSIIPVDRWSASNDSASPSRRKSSSGGESGMKGNGLSHGIVLDDGKDTPLRTPSST